ncbi:MAG: hypothetical protein LBT25_11645 [Candidatus Symbiothrix sp.]|jgi:hypothetical protein|nr:hypothetical protein [Candidatus Symbiothrix sp.]
MKTSSKIKCLNGLFFIFIITILIGFLYQFFEPSPYKSWGVSDFLINYQGGFVRRGLLGEILFFLTRHFGWDIVWVIKIISAVCCIAVCAYFTKEFLRKGYTWYILPLCFFCGGPLMGFSWIRKDFMMLGIFISIFLIYHHKSLPSLLKFILVNLLSLFMILSHEVFAFFFLPVFFIVLFAAYKETGRSILTAFGRSFLFLLPCIVAFLVVLANHGNMETAQAIWESWHVLTNKEMEPLQWNNSITAIGWDSVWAFTHHYKSNFFIADHGILSFFSWIITFPIVYYIAINALAVFKKNPEIYTENNRTILSSLIFFQFVCLLPLFTILSVDMIRIFFYLIASSFAMFLIVPGHSLEVVFPAKFTGYIAKINKGLDEIVRPTKATISMLMLIICIPPYSFVLYFTATSSVIYRVLVFFSQIFIFILKPFGLPYEFDPPFLFAD